MPIDEAIEILKGYEMGKIEAEDGKFDEAIQLGQEALTRISYARDGHIETIYQPLPGETKD